MKAEKPLPKWLPDANLTFQRIWRYLRYPLLIGLIVAVFWIVPIQDVVATLKTADYAYVLAAILVTIPVFYLEALQFKIMTDKLGMNIKAWEILSINLVVKFYSLVLPGTFVASGIRWYRFSSASNQPMSALAALTYSRLFNIFLSIFLGVGFWLMASRSGSEFNVVQVGLMFVGITLAMYLLPRLSQTIVGWLSKWESKFQGKRLLEFIYRNLSKVMVSFAAYRDLTWWEYLKLIVFGLTSQMISLYSYTLLAKALHLEIPWMQMGWIRSFALLAVYLPINFSPGLGMREIGLGAILLAVGIGAEQTVAFTLLVMFRTIVFSLFGGVIELTRGIRKRQEKAA